MAATDNSRDPSATGEEPGLILVVEDDPSCALVVRRRLEHEGLRVIHAPDGRAGLVAARAEKPDLIITDWMLPGLDGPSLCEIIRSEPEIAATYVIILSSKTERAERVEGLDRGADDYLAKDSNNDELLARVRAGLRIRKLQKELVHQARTDALTGLWNRGFFHAALDRELERARRYRRPLSVAMLDLDRFKAVNDTLGHLAGDAAIRHTARLLSESCRAADVIGRFGGDEFAVIFVEATAQSASDVLARLLVRMDTEPCRHEDHSIRVSASYGVAQFDLAHHSAADDLLRDADLALYAMKSKRHEVLVDRPEA